MEILLHGLLGMIWGSAVSSLGFYAANKALGKNSRKWARFVFAFRIAFAALAMFLVRHNTAALIGTALGLLLIKNLILISTVKGMISEKRKG